MLTLNVSSDTEGNRINGTIDGVKFNVAHTEDMYDALVGLQTDLEKISTVEDYDVWVDAVKDQLENSDEGDIITSACKDLALDNKTGNYYVKVGTKVSKHAVPEPLVNVMLESAEKGIDPTPIVKAWIRFLRNPNFTPRKAMLFAKYVTATIIDGAQLDEYMEEGYTYEKSLAKAEYNDVAITNEGLIVTKKYARLLTEGWIIDPETNQAVLKDLFKTTKDVDAFSGEVTESTEYPDFAEDLTFEPPIMGKSGDAFLCGDKEGHVVKVGQVHELESWSQVNTDDDTNCVSGLHVGRICRLAA